MNAKRYLKNFIMMFGVLFFINLCYVDVFGEEKEADTAYLHEYEWKVWDSSGPQSIEKLIMSNGVVVDMREDSFGRYVYATGEENSSQGVVVSDAAVHILNAYPNKINPSIVLGYYGNGGNSVQWEGVFALEAQGNYIKKYLIDGSVKKIVFSIDRSGKIKKAEADLYSGKDRYGSRRVKKIDFVSEVGFVDKKVNSKYYKLIGVYPECFFEDQLARLVLLRVVGFERFRSLRDCMSVASESRLISGRYLLFNGCFPHSCSDRKSAILIDTYDDSCWWTEVEGNKSIAGGSSKRLNIANDDYENLWMSLQGMAGDHGEWMLGIDQQGRFTYKK